MNIILLAFLECLMHVKCSSVGYPRLLLSFPFIFFSVVEWITPCNSPWSPPTPASYLWHISLLPLPPPSISPAPLLSSLLIPLTSHWDSSTLVTQHVTWFRLQNLPPDDRILRYLVNTNFIALYQFLDFTMSNTFSLFCTINFMVQTPP